MTRQPLSSSSRNTSARRRWSYSGHDQKADLQRQVEVLKGAYGSKFSDVVVLTDVGSGLSTNRRSLRKAMQMARERKIRAVAVTYPDRLTRFCFEYLKEYFNSFGVEVLVLNREEDRSPQQELVEDLLTIVTSFAGKLYGHRSHAELQEKLAAGGTLCAPDLRLKVKPGGELVALLDVKVDVPEEKPSGDPGRALSVDWGLRKLVTCTVVSRKGQLTPPFFVFWSGLKARLFRIREDIKKLQKERDRYEKGTPDWKKYNRKIAAAWQKYHRVQHTLAHAVSTLLVLLARAFGCRHIFIEWLVTLHGKKGRNRDLNWWVSTVVRGLLFRLLRYKAKLAGIRVFMVPPGGTSRVCPRCLGAGKHVISPGNKAEKDSGSWFVCPSCGWQADRDYAGSLNIARVGFNLARPLSYKVGGAAMPFPSRVASAEVLREAMTFTTTLGYTCSVFPGNIGCLVKLLDLQCRT
ncbi:IS607 family transposase [Desulfofundulus thermocisternus]|uniref:IS607 family transposase n=1 Tax=Desulfofundulus thermocisternus TaxID=42471 RepID=UPI00217D45DD|nr:IS607 family transposase [Desulfofundulus thermocisternus]